MPADTLTREQIENWRRRCLNLSGYASPPEGEPTRHPLSPPTDATYDKGKREINTIFDMALHALPPKPEQEVMPHTARTDHAEQDNARPPATSSEPGALPSEPEVREMIEELRKQAIAAPRIYRWMTDELALERMLEGRAASMLSRLSAERNAVLEEAVQVAMDATLPAGYQWGHDAMEQFDFGKRRATDAIRALKSSAAAEPGRKAKPLADWHEDFGPALWWKFPVEEPPYSGSPLDTDWPGYHTHWTPILIPDAPSRGSEG